MHPELLKIGPFALKTYGLFVAAGVWIGYLIFIRLLKNSALAVRDSGFTKTENLNQQIANQAQELTFWVILGGILGARLLYVLLHLEEYESWFGALKIWEGGLAFQGGLAGGLAGGAFFLHRRKISFWSLADAAAVALAFGHGLGRLGCFSAGCCYGKPSDLPWAVSFPPGGLAPTGVLLHPTQIYDAGLQMLLGGLLIFLFWRRRFKGETFCTYLFFSGLLRFFMEFLRGDSPVLFIVQGRFQIFGLTFFQIAALGLAAVGAGLFFWRSANA